MKGKNESSRSLLGKLSPAHRNGLPNKQTGITMISMVVIIAIIAFLALIALRLFPIYFEHWKMASHLESIASDPANKTMTNAAMNKALLTRFGLDDITNVTGEHIFFEQNEDGEDIIAIEYEVRTPAIGNVDMVVSFVDEVVRN